MANYDLTALSGLNAASDRLGLISNNIANSQTVGYKSTRGEFSDMYASATSNYGSGVRMTDTSQNWSQGSINATSNELDLAMDGEGMFIMNDPSGQYGALYSRNGSFKVDDEGYITSYEGYRLQGYLKNKVESTPDKPVFQTTLDDLNLSELNSQPKETDELNLDMNLNSLTSHQTVLMTAAAGATPTTANGVSQLTNVSTALDAAITAGAPYSPDFSTTKDVYDSLGGEHRMQFDMYKTETYTAGTTQYTDWHVRVTVSDYDEATNTWNISAEDANNPGQNYIDYTLRFDENGEMQYLVDNTGAVLDKSAGQNLESNLPFTFTNITPGAAEEADLTLGNPDVAVNFEKMTQYAGSNDIRSVSQNGYGVGDFSGIEISTDGVITASYSNGLSNPIAQLAVATFEDKSALGKIGGQMYSQTYESGEARIGTPQSTGFGSIESGALETSNVDTTKELVDMISAQRMYQASAQILSTSRQLTQTILQL